MSMSNDLMINTVEKMQIELSRAMEDIKLLADELKKRIESVSVVDAQTTEKKVIKLKKKVPQVDQVVETKKKTPTGIVSWNAYVSLIRTEMQEEPGTKVKNEDVLAKAIATKLADPEGYKEFCSNWLSTHNL
jgi:hypothetical protein